MKWVFRSAQQAEADCVTEDWGSLAWLSSEALTASDLTLGRVIIKRGMSNPTHSHPDSSEVLYLLRGKLKHVLGTDTVLMEPGDTSFVPAGMPHVAYSVGDEDAEMIVAYPTGRRRFQVEK